MFLGLDRQLVLSVSKGHMAQHILILGPSVSGDVW